MTIHRTKNKPDLGDFNRIERRWGIHGIWPISSTSVILCNMRFGMQSWLAKVPAPNPHKTSNFRMTLQAFRKISPNRGQPSIYPDLFDKWHTFTRHHGYTTFQPCHCHHLVSMHHWRPPTWIILPPPSHTAETPRYHMYIKLYRYIHKYIIPYVNIYSCNMFAEIYTD